MMSYEKGRVSLARNRRPFRPVASVVSGRHHRLVPIASVVVAILLVCGCSSGDPSSDLIRLSRDLKRGPYVQLGSVDSILIVWQTFPESQGAVEFGLTESLGTRVESATVAREHSVHLTGLAPGTSYYYRILDSRRPLSLVTQFQTSPGPDDTAFSFLVLGDSGSGTTAMTQVASLVNASTASFGLHTGDVVYPNGEEQLYDPMFFWPYAPFLARSVLYMSLGNHDLHTDDGAPYLNNFYLPANNVNATERYYSFDYGHAHFVALDTNLPIGPGTAQYLWLEQDLATTAQPWKFVFFHHPPYSAGFTATDGRQAPLRSSAVRLSLVPLFERFGVNIVFSGHAHSYERTFPMLQNTPTNGDQEPNYVDPPGPIYVVTGGGGGDLTELAPDSFNARAFSGYHVVEVAISDNRLIGKALAPGDVVLDEFRVELR